MVMAGDEIAQEFLLRAVMAVGEPCLDEILDYFLPRVNGNGPAGQLFEIDA